MTIQEYLDNPMGKGDASIINRKIIQESMMSKFHKYVNKKGKLIKMRSYVTAGGEYYIHLILPSETDRDNTYDIAFRFYDPDKKFIASKSVRDYQVQMFSNDPSFAYTFAYVYHENGLMVRGLEERIGKEFISKKPVVRNSHQIVNYEKYLFFGAKYLLENNFLNRVYLTTHATTFLQVAFVKSIRPLSTIMTEYHKAERQLSKEKKYAKAQETKEKSRKEPKGRKEPAVHKVEKLPKKKGGRSHQVNKIRKK